MQKKHFKPWIMGHIKLRHRKGIWAEKIIISDPAYAGLSQINSSHHLRVQKGSWKMTWWQGGGVWISPKIEDVIYEQPLSTTRAPAIAMLKVWRNTCKLNVSKIWGGGLSQCPLILSISDPVICTHYDKVCNIFLKVTFISMRGERSTKMDKMLPISPSIVTKGIVTPWNNLTYNMQCQYITKCSSWKKTFCSQRVSLITRSTN